MPGGGGIPGVVPPDGRVSGDPNLKFDETAYNQLTTFVDNMLLSLDRNAVVTNAMVLDSEWAVTPPDQQWTPAKLLYDRGIAFGGSVEAENEKLRTRLSRFRTALISAKDVFTETDDLAAYSATVFVTEYPDFGGSPAV